MDEVPGRFTLEGFGYSTSGFLPAALLSLVGDRKGLGRKGRRKEGTKERGKERRKGRREGERNKEGESHKVSKVSQRDVAGNGVELSPCWSMLGMHHSFPERR